MQSNNPVLTSLERSESRGGYRVGYGEPASPMQTSPMGYQGSRPITVDDIVSKTGITLGVIVLFAAINFALVPILGTAGPTMLLTFVGAIGGLVTVLISTFGKKYGSAAVTLAYAVFEGLFLGGFSGMVAGFDLVGNGTDAGVLIGQAILGTFGVFAGMLYVYKSGAVKVTPKMRRIVTAMLFGVLALVLGNLIGSIFLGFNPLRDGGMIAIIFSLAVIALGAFTLLMDFDSADQMVRAGAPAEYAWGIALGLAVSIVWLYTEILRFLSYFNRS